MMFLRAAVVYRLLFLVGLACCVATIGCTSSSAPEKPPQAGETPADDAEAAPAKPFKLGDMVEPFEAPPLEELDAKANWTDREVRSGLDAMRELVAQAGPPELTAEEALKLKNDSPEDNEKLQAALGQMAPEDAAGVDYEATVTVQCNSDLKSSNPILYSSVTEGEYHDLTAIALLTFDKNFDWFADENIVQSWQASEDRLIHKFVLRDDLYWSDGKRVTAHDFEFSFNVIMTEAVTVPALRTGPQELRGVKAYDDRTLVVFHKEALPTSVENMQFYAIPKHIYAETIPKDPTLSRSKAHSRLEDTPVVAGPYELAKRVRSKEFVLRRREGYYLRDGEQVRDKPYFKTIRMKYIEDLNTALIALKKSDLEVMELQAEQWVTQTNGPDFYKHNTKTAAVEWAEYHITWNTKSPLFSDPRCRWAMTYAMDYEELMETICYGLYEQCRGVYHPDSWMYPDDAPPLVRQDLDKAQQLLTEAGWEDTDGDGVLDKMIDGRSVPFEFTFNCGTKDINIKTATLFKECLDLLGIVCNVKPTEFTALMEMNQTKEFTASMSGWITGTDPSTNENIFGTGKPRNYGSYSNPEVDRLFEEGKREFDRDKRAKIYGKIHNLMWEDQPYTWLYYRSGFYGFNKKLRGHNRSPRGPFSFSPGMQGMWVPAAAP